ncbi:hypothetical protein MMC10_000138 [Thelotrema lepadinum]|nr:hypothetical protein [Thelotrema lepadinum]
MASGYEGKDIDHFEETVDENLQEWIQWIQKSALSGPGRSEIFDIARSIQWLDFDLICRLCFGHCLNFIKSHSDQHDFQKVLEERLPIVEQFGVFMEVGSMIKFISRVPLLRKLLPSAEDKTGIGKIRGMARAALDARTNPDFTPRNDIPGAWLNKGVPRGQVETEMVIALFAGSDTTATSLRATLLYVISNPLVYARLTQEIRSVLKVNAIPAEEVVPNTLAKSLPYLQACIKEGLRIFPPVTAMRERLTPPEGDCLLGHKIPGGVRIGVSMRSLLRDKVAFAPDPEVFRPERWLECEAQVMQRMERVHELVFNWGFTRCLGINLASMMSSKFFVECFRRWDITLVTPETPWESRCHGVFYQKHFWVRISPTQLALSE